MRLVCRQEFTSAPWEIGWSSKLNPIKTYWGDVMAKLAQRYADDANTPVFVIFRRNQTAFMTDRITDVRDQKGKLEFVFPDAWSDEDKTSVLLVVRDLLT